MFRGDFLKARKMLARRIIVAFALVGTSYAELRRSVIRKRGQRLLKLGNGFVVLLKLRVQVSQEVVGVGFRRKLRDVLEGIDPFFGFAGVFVDQAEIVPGIWICGQKA